MRESPLMQNLTITKATITKLEIGDYGFCSADLTFDAGMSVEDFDLSQLGEVNSSGTDGSGRGWVTFSNEEPLKIGDAITTEIGGDPIISTSGKVGSVMKVAARAEGDYRNAFADKHGQNRDNF